MNRSPAHSVPLGERTGLPPVASRPSSWPSLRPARGGVNHRRRRLPLCLGGARRLAVLVPAVAVQTGKLCAALA
jgi:hypothetical protein